MKLSTSLLGLTSLLILFASILAIQARVIPGHEHILLTESTNTPSADIPPTIADNVTWKIKEANDSPIEQVLEQRARWEPLYGGSLTAAEFENIRCKGEKLNYMTSISDAQAGQYFTPPRFSAASDWTDVYSHFAGWGYSFGIDPDECDVTDDTDEGLGIADALNAIGVSTANEDWTCYTVEHGWMNSPTINTETYSAPDGRTMRKTGARYTVAINLDEGVLVNKERYSPAHMGRNRNPPIASPNDFPMLRTASDIRIAWGIWEAVHAERGDSPGRLRYVFGWFIINSVTAPAIRKALDTRNVDLTVWPGQSWTMNDAVGQALLGSPNGVGVAYFLIQHKAALGNQVVSKVTVFKGSHESWQEPIMLFELAD